MFKIRIIPCLDVKDGRIVKGVNFERPAAHYNVREVVCGFKV